MFFPTFGGIVQLNTNDNPPKSKNPEFYAQGLYFESILTLQAQTTLSIMIFIITPDNHRIFCVRKHVKKTYC
jgi:hypothetical protein